ncbi:MAG TPA: substrate-binding domain-containing protein [Marinagarivorans sp.]
MAAACVAGFSVAPQALASRDHIMVVGSSTVFPFSKVVAERFGRKTNFKAPKIEPTGTGGGFKEFCKGVGVNYPDIVNASRRVKASEYQDCQKNGVTDIVEVLIGYDGIVIANSVDTKQMTLSLKDVFLGLAKMVPDPKAEGKLIENPYQTWKDVNPSLPATKIEVLGPPPTSGTRDAFVELAMEGGCTAFPWIKELKSTDKNKFKALCHGLREDGAFVEAGENDNLIVRKLSENPKALGIFGFSFLDQNADKVHPAIIGGARPTFESISDGSYVVSRPLYFYAKKAHVGVIPGIEEFLAEFTNDRAWGDEGYLTEKGLIPLSSKERKRIAKRVKDLEPVAL